MSKKIKDEQKKFLGETLNQYDKALNEGINQLDKKNREQNHKISSLTNSFDNEYLEKDVEGNMTALENSKDGMVIINEIQGSTEVNYCKDGEKELILNGDIDTQGESFVTLTEGVDGGLVDVSLEGNTEINLSNTKDPVLVTREFDDIDCNTGKLQYTIDDVTTINDEPGKVDIDRIVGDTMVNHAVNGSEELILNAHINESGDNNITLNGVTSDGGKVDVALEGNTLVNVSNVKDDYITPTIEDKVDQGSVISLPEVSEGLVNIDSIEGNTLVNYCTDGAKELTLNGDIDVEGNFVTTTEGVDNGLVDVALEGNTLVNYLDFKNYISKPPEIVIEGNKLIFNGSNSFPEIHYNHSVFKPNTEYTIIGNVEEKTEGIGENQFILFRIGEGDGTDSINTTIYADTVGKFKIKFTTPTNIVIASSYLRNTVTIGERVVVSGLSVLEGDWTDKEIPQYFEGMKSVGQDDENGHKVEIVSQNKNLIDINRFSPAMNKGTLSIDGDTITYDYKGSYPYIKQIFTQEEINLLKGKTFKFGHGGITDTVENNKLNIRFVAVVDGVDNYYSFPSTESYTRTVTLPDNIESLEFSVVPNNTSADIQGTFTISNMQLLFADTKNTNYVKHQSNKKEILLNEPLRSLPNGTKDRFVKIGGKWFVERNCGSIGLSEIINNVVLGDSTKEETIRFKWKTSEIPNMEPKVGFNFYCNNFKYAKYSDDIEGIDIGKDLDCNILRSKLQTQDIDGFKQWVGNNPTTIIYELATPTYEPLEIEPTLNTYNEITHLSNNSIIPCNMQIKNTGYNAIIKPSTLYTIALDTDKSETVVIDLGGMKTVTTNNVVTITTPAILSDDSLRLYGKGIKASKVRLLEGDKTNWIPSFFEGMKSSFEDKVQEDGSYKMEVLMNNKNLVKLKSENVYKLGEGSSYVIHSENSLTLKGTMEYSHIRIRIEQKLKPLTKYYISYDATLIKGSNAMVRVTEHRPGVSDVDTVLYNGNRLTTNNKTHIEGTFTTKYISDLALLINSAWDIAEDSELLVENLQISEVVSDFIPHKSNKIQLSSIKPLRGINEIHDRLVFKDGKLMIERNIGEVTIKDNISYIEVVNDINKLHTTRVLLDKNMFPNIKLKTDYYFRSDRFKHALWNSDVEGFSIGSNLDLNILSIRLSSLDAEGVKEWFRNNPTKFAYLLAEPTYEEIPYDLQKIILESYDNGTLFIDTNIPPTKVSFNCFEEELTYLYPSTSYTIQFNSDRTTTADITLGGTELLAQNVVKGLNRITITTPETLADNKLIIDGVGAKINDVVVTDTDREFMYFEGMKSVGENGLKIYSGKPQRFGKGGRI